MKSTIINRFDLKYAANTYQTCAGKNLLIFKQKIICNNLKSQHLWLDL